jgi:hypothetical protein
MAHQRAQDGIIERLRIGELDQRRLYGNLFRSAWHGLSGAIAAAIWFHEV